MNNLYRELAPITPSAWSDIEEEAQRTLKEYLGARRIVDVHDPQGVGLSAVGTGHKTEVKSIVKGVQSLRREVNPVIELRVPFELSRSAIDDVERGSRDSDWQPLKDAALKIALAEDTLVFQGYPEGGILGIATQSSNAGVSLPKSASGYARAVAAALTQLRLQGVNGPYALALGTEAFTLASGGSEEGYPILRHLERLLDVPVVWSPAIEGGLLVTLRGGDFDLWLGQDISIGYQSHTTDAVQLYFQETLTFRTQTAEASVVLKPE